MDNLLAFLAALAALVPVVSTVAPLVAFVVDTAKRIGLPNGYAPLVSGLLNLLAFAAMFFLTDAQKAQIPDAVAGILAVAPFVVALLISVLATPVVHDMLTAKGLGFSHGSG